MKRICYYVSDHGWGHASRSVAVIRELLAWDKDIEIIVKADYALRFMRSSIRDERVTFDRSRKDFGFFLENGNLQVDKVRTQELLARWLAAWDQFIEQERSFCKVHDIRLIISDIAPQPFLVADSLDIPGVAISNFTWYGVYSHLFGETEEVFAIREAYQQADLALVLPLAEKDLPFRRAVEIGLVTRRPTVGRRELRRRLGAPPLMNLVYVGAGGITSSAAVASAMLNALSSECSSIGDVGFLVSSHVGISGSNRNVPVLRIPADDPESQNYIAACDLLISKAGYSTVSEAICGRVPMLLVAREGISEDESIVRAVEELGVARRISLSEDRRIDLRSLSPDSDDLKRAYQRLPGSYRRDGNKEAAKHILRVLESRVMSLESKDS